MAALVAALAMSVTALLGQANPAQAVGESTEQARVPAPSFIISAQATPECGVSSRTFILPMTTPNDCRVQRDAILARCGGWPALTRPVCIAGAHAGYALCMATASGVMVKTGGTAVKPGGGGGGIGSW